MAFGVAIVLVVLGTAAGHSGDWLVTTAYTVGEISCLFGIPAAMTIAILRHRLAGVVYRALEPAHVSVWIKERG